MKDTITLVHFSDFGDAAVAQSDGAHQAAGEPDADETTAGNTTSGTAPETGGEEESEIIPDECGKADEIAERAKQTVLRACKDNLKRTWSQDAEKLKEIYPSFNIGEELRNNERLGTLLRAGVPLKNAYEVTHLDEIIGAAMRYAARKASEKTANSIVSGSARPSENGIMNSAPSVTRTDVRSLSEKDILKILDRVSRGETVSF